MTDNNLKVFGLIHNFVKELTGVYRTNKPLRLYNRLLEKTTLSHHVSIKKHIDAFQTFCVQNRDVLTTKDHKKLVKHRIMFNDNIYVDMFIVLDQGDDEIKDAIWRHILTIASYVDPTGNALQVLKETIKSDSDDSEEEKLIDSIIEKINENIKTDSTANPNPMTIINSIMQSGLLNKIFEQAGSGKLNFNKLIGVANKLIAKFGQENDLQTAQASQLLNTMSSMMGGASASGRPDMSQIMGMMTTVMSGMSSLSPQEEKK